jgi:hypothetical protein
MRYGGYLALAALAACNTLLVPTSHKPMKVTVLDIAKGVEPPAEPGQQPQTILLVKARFDVQDPRAAVLNDASYDLRVDGQTVGRGLYSVKTGVEVERVIDLPVRRFSRPPDEIVKLFQQTRKAQLRGSLHYRMIDGGQYEHPFASE